MINRKNKTLGKRDGKLLFENKKIVVIVRW